MTDFLPYVFVFIFGIAAGMFAAALLIRYMVRYDGWQLIAPDDGQDNESQNDNQQS
jgi:hypothetical protein